MIRFSAAILALTLGLWNSAATADDSPVVIPHSTLSTYSFHGNTVRGIATKGLGAEQFEAWSTSIAAGSATPLHANSTEEVVVFWRGKGKIVTESEEVEFESPCTLILPANVKHQFVNTGDEPARAAVIMGTDSVIYNAGDQEMQLPWRK